MDFDRGAASTPLLRQMNAQSVLRFALRSGVFYASEAIVATGLTRSTVIGLCDYLVDLGWIRRLDDSRAAGEYSKGRPARRFELSADAGVVVGVDAGEHSVSVIVSDLRGRALGRARRSFGTAGLDPENRVSVMTDAVESALVEGNASREAVLTTVIGVPAPTDDAGRSPDGEGGYWAKMNPHLALAFAGFGRVVVENDANLAAVAEQTIGAGRGAHSFAALLSGERFGAGLIIDNTLIRGRQGGAGEMRMLGIVEGVGSASGLAALAREWAGNPPGTDPSGAKSAAAPPSTRAPSAEEVLAAAAAGDESSLDIVGRLGDRLARVCFVLTSLLDVERVIVVGAIAVAADTIIEEARAVLARDFPPPVPEIVASTLGADAVVLGAIQRGLALVHAAPLQFAPAGVTSAPAVR